MAIFGWSKSLEEMSEKELLVKISKQLRIVIIILIIAIFIYWAFNYGY
jgi:hypothetical protein